MDDEMSVCRYDPCDTHISQTIDGSDLVSELSIVRAQKSSSEFALSSAKIKYESKMKHLKTEKEIIESEKNSLLSEHNSLKRKYQLLEFERSYDQSKFSSLRRTLDDRMNSVLQSSNGVESSLTSEAERLRDEVLKYEKQITELHSTHANLQVRVKELEALLDLRSQRLKELEMYVEEKSAELKELAELKSTVFKLTSEKTVLEERLAVESNRTKMPEGYDRFVRGAGYVAKLEMEHDRVKTAFKTLSQERAKWLITEEENSELRNQIELLKKWRERALIAENSLLEKETLMNTLVSKTNSPGSIDSSSSLKLRKLERENEILLAEQGELSAKNKELLKTIEEKQSSEADLQSQLQSMSYQIQEFKQIQTRSNQIVQRVVKEYNLCQNLLQSYSQHESDTFNIPSEYLKSMSNLKQLFEDFNRSYKDCTNCLNDLSKLTEKGKNGKSNYGDSVSNVSSSVHSIHEDDRDLVGKLRQQISELEEKIEKLQTTNAELLDKLDVYHMQGVCDTRTTRILTYKHNPAAIFKQNLSKELSELRLLTERQRQRIQVLEERIVHLTQNRDQQKGDTDLTMDLDVTNVVESRLRSNPDPLTELAETKEQLRVERLRGDRLMELFDKAKAKYRASCRDLLGYRINIQSCGDCQVCPVFSVSEEDNLYFKKVDGQYELVENRFSKSLPEDIHQFLKVNHSIPGFLASVTLHFLRENTLLM
uniref:Spindle assembly checkpoint component MAD1 n=1 Tax=Trichobilharzia regenti TaxID=157069 RepID=A0AA85J1B5_TRIRE|nr:unnamed protein product [Trichobilharzia regenti]